MPQAISVALMRYGGPLTTSVAYGDGEATGGLATPVRSTWMVVMMQLRQGDLTWQRAGDDVVVLDLVGSVYLKLNGSGRLLWETLAEPTTERALVAALMEHYGIDESRAAADVTAFLDDLRARGMLVE
jgi:Coenzyme PQQ synthesis protein D (PqqD)